MPSVEGLAARRAALQLLDSVLRRGQTLDAAAGVGSRTVAARPRARPRHRRRGAAPLARPRRADRRRDPPPPSRRQQGADGAPLGACAEGRARHARARPGRDRASASRWRPAPPRPWRARHPPSAWRARDGCAAPAARVEQRWRAAWGDATVEAARRQIAQRPPLDLTFGDDAEAQAYAAANDGVSLAPRHVRLASARSPSCPASRAAVGGSRTLLPRSPRD